MNPSAPNRLKAGTAVVMVHLALAAALLFGLTSRPPAAVERSIATFDVMPPPPPPHPIEQPRTRVHAGRAAPRNLTAKPAAVILPPPPPRIVPPPPIVAAPVAGPGAASRAGASSLPGPGSGAGGQGDGRGSGGAGDGDGDGDIPPRHVGGRIRDSDYPRALLAARIGGTVGVRYRVGVDGRVSDCVVTASSGTTELDSLTCRLIEQRFRFEPSRDADGRRVPSLIVEHHTWIADPADDPDQ